MVWMIDGNEVDSFGPRSVPSDSFPQEPVNIILQNVTVGDIESETSFISFMWFNISTYPASSVTCGSNKNSSSIYLNTPGNSHTVQ